MSLKARRHSSAEKVRSKLANRFYEPIIFLLGINTAWKNNQATKIPDLSPDVAYSSKDAFHSFVNKLCQLCDSERGGKTVTAFLVLQLPDRIQYRFASNQRDEQDLIRTQKFVKYILDTLGTAPGSPKTTSNILKECLSSNRSRVNSYISSLKTHTPLCIDSCKDEETEDTKSIIEKLGEIQDLLDSSDFKNLLDNAFSDHCENLITVIDRLYKSDVNELIRSKTNEGRMNESKRWCEFRHASGRLLSYLGVVRVLVSMRKQHPELFENFEVCYVASSLPTQCPLRNKNKVDQLSMKSIIGRMTSVPKEMELYQKHAQELEKFGVNEAIRKEATKKNFRPIVHAEILLLETLERDGGVHPSRFFNGYRYIGCSKPLCRLCDYYFSFHASEIEVRPTHRNLYSNWRLPDVYPEQGPKAVQKREELMMKILGRIRDDTTRTLTEKLPERKPHDSNTEPTLPKESNHGYESDNTDLGTTFSNLEIDYPQDEISREPSPTSSIDTVDFFAGDDIFDAEDSDEEEEEEHGGVKL